METLSKPNCEGKIIPFLCSTKGNREAIICFYNILTSDPNKLSFKFYRKVIWSVNNHKSFKSKIRERIRALFMLQEKLGIPNGVIHSIASYIAS